MSENREVASFNISITETHQGQGVQTSEMPAGTTVREVLTQRGVDLSTPVMVNGSPTTLNHVLENNDVVASSKPGKGA